jgi:hypothetical protein
MRLVRAAVAATLVLAAIPAAAYVRETTAVGSPKEGVCLWWGTRTVTYRVNAAAVTHTACPSPATAEAEVALGFDAWGAASTCTDFRFVHGASTSQLNVAADGVNLVVFRMGRCAAGQTPAANNCWDSQNYGATTTAITTTHFDNTTGQITDADMELFAWDGISPTITNGHYFSCGGEGAPTCGSFTGTACNDTDIQAVVTHEAGHVLGLDHVCEYGEIRTPPQYPSCSAAGASYPQIMNPLVGAYTDRGPKPDDVAGVCAIYPKGGATLTCGSAPKKSSGGCSAGGADAVGLVVAALAVARLRRRRG